MFNISSLPKNTTKYLKEGRGGVLREAPHGFILLKESYVFFFSI